MLLQRHRACTNRTRRWPSSCWKRQLAVVRAGGNPAAAWLGGSAVGLSLLLGAASPAGLHAEEMSIAFPASADPEIRAAQQTLVESWGASTCSAGRRCVLWLAS